MMKMLWLLLPALAGCISAEESDRSFITSCSQIELDPSRGFLYAFCSSLSSEKVDHVSQVDLNGCLAWGPVNGPEFMKDSENELFPAEG